MTRRTFFALSAFLPAWLALCAPALAAADASSPDENRLLPTPDLVLEIPGLGPCNDNPDRRLQLRRGEPVKLMVHGCRGSAGEFRSLSRVFAFQGQQSACFSYDDRAALDDAAGGLRRALQQLADATPGSALTLIGHSQGALISRRAVSTQALSIPDQAVPAVELVTISGPFAGIAAAAPCGWTWLHVLSLGLTAASCRIGTGAKWTDISAASHFIRAPGALSPGVSRHLKIDTDERDSCRREEGGRCVESDEIFSLAEQRSPTVEADPRTQRLELQAGHVEVVGDRHIEPRKLIALLQREGVLRQAAPSRQAAFSQLISRLYGPARKD
ncbi:esterase/lipase family protein [Uliginosibacterium paludis]|uniref:Alpha/beta hydrolase n=1 Tax=Uliginosibacterium paludis TaxID=1615952 RepID=A0ABV2CV93_9RHOO